MTRAFALIQTAPSHTKKYGKPKQRSVRRSKHAARAEEIKHLRKGKIQGRILDYVMSQEKAVIYAETLDCLILDLMSASVTGASLRGESQRSAEGTFKEIQTLLLQGVPELTLHIEVGHAMLGVKEAYWPMTPFSLYSDDGRPAVPEHMLRRCLRGKHTVHDY